MFQIPDEIISKQIFFVGGCIEDVMFNEGLLIIVFVNVMYIYRFSEHSSRLFQ